MLSKEANLIKQKQKKIQNEFENEIYLFWETYPKRIYNINDFYAYKDFLEKDDALACLRVMVKKYETIFEQSSFEEKNNIIKSIKILRKFMFEYSKELTSYVCTNIPQYENTKKALLEKAKTFLANEIVEYQHEKYQRALKESEENNKKIERRDLLLNDIKSL